MVSSCFSIREAGVAGPFDLRGSMPVLSISPRVIIGALAMIQTSFSRVWSRFSSDIFSAILNATKYTYTGCRKRLAGTLSETTHVETRECVESKRVSQCHYQDSKADFCDAL